MVQYGATPMQYGATPKFINITHTTLRSQCQMNTPPGNNSGEQQLEKKYGLLFRYALMTILKSTTQQHSKTTQQLNNFEHFEIMLSNNLQFKHIIPI